MCYRSAKSCEAWYCWKRRELATLPDGSSSPYSKSPIASIFPLLALETNKWCSVSDAMTMIFGEIYWREKTLESLVYTLNRIYLQDHAVRYQSIEDEPREIAAEPRKEE